MFSDGFDRCLRCNRLKEYKQLHNNRCKDLNDCQSGNFIIVKSSRKGGFPYQGPSCIQAEVEPGKIYTDVDEAIADAKKLDKVNPVGFFVRQLFAVLITQSLPTT